MIDERGLRSRSLGWAWTGSCQDWDNELFVISCHHMALISFTSVGTIYLSFARWLPTSSRSNTVCGDVWFYLIPLLGNVGGLNDTIRIWTFASLNLRPNLGAYQGDGLITLTDFRYLTVLDHVRLEGGLIKGKVLDLARLVGGLIKGKVRSCSAICASTPVTTCSNLPTPPTPTYTKHFSTSSFHQITIPVAPDWFAPKSRQNSYKLGREVHLLRRRKLGQQGVERYNAGLPWCIPQSLQQSFMQNQKHGIFGGDD